MKKLFIIVFIFISFQTLVKADNINDFEIEEMSIGESLLDYLDKDTILQLINSKSANYYPNKSFVVFTYNNKSFKTYDNLGIVIKPDDINYIIHSIEGTIYMNDCRKKQLEISKELKVFFSEEIYDFFSNENLNYIDDKSGESKVHYEDFYFSDNSAVRVICWSMSKKFIDNGYKNNLVVAVNSKDFMNWIEENM